MSRKISNAERDKFGGMLIIDKLPGYFLLFCLIVSFAYLIDILRPFITVLFVSVILVISFYPLYKKLVKLFRGNRGVASFIASLLIVLLILVPLTYFIIFLSTEAFSLYEVIQLKINSGAFDNYLKWKEGGYLYELKQQIDPVIDLDGLDAKKSIINMAQSLSSYLVSQTTTFINGVFSIFIGVVVMLFSVYYFFKDGTKLVARLGALSPLPFVYEEELFKQIASMVKAVVFGVFLTAIVQGFFGGIGFYIAGITSPVFWGAAIAFFSLVPVVGTALIWVPASIVLAIMGQWGMAIFLFIWGLLIIGSVDNFIRPYLIGSKAKTYPLMTFLVVLGGVLTKGLIGVVIGPLLLIILMSFLHIYEAEYKKVLKK